MIGKRLRRALEYRDVSQAELARQLDKDVMVINRWVNDKHIPDVDSIAGIAQVLRVSADYLLGLVPDDQFHGHFSKGDLTPADLRVLSARDASSPLDAIRKFIDVLEEREQKSPRERRRVRSLKPAPKRNQK